MKITPGIEVVEPFPAIYLKKLGTLVIADLHLGYEGIMAERGVLLPKVQFREEIKMLKGILEEIDADTIVLNGDVKHEFSETTYHEFKEVKDLFSFLTSQFSEVVVIKGNHDNYLGRLTTKYNITLHEELRMKKYLFFHGHKLPEDRDSEYLILGHEHPALAFYDEIGAKEKVDCFLVGESIEGKKVIVLPAFSTLAQGSEINLIPSSHLLSPYLREKVIIEDFRAIATSLETGCLKFGKLGRLRGGII